MTKRQGNLRPPFCRALLAFAFGTLLFSSALPAAALDPGAAVVPEAASGRSESRLVRATRDMVVSAHPLASAAGQDMLRQGGTAIDATVAVQAVLGLVEPQSSGLGGGAFLLFYDAAQKRLTSFDGRETAPREAGPTLFLDANGQPLQFFDAVVGGRSVGTPGTVRLLAETHARYGKLPLAEVLQPAIDLAEKGFPVSPRLATLLAEEGERLQAFEPTRRYFFDDGGRPWPAGHRLANPDYARTLRAIAEKGADGFYAGPLAEEIVSTVRNAPRNPGRLSLADLRDYRIAEREPVCIAYRRLDVCGMGPPSSGGLTVGQILGLLEPTDIAALGPQNPESFRLLSEASRLAFADRGRYMADIDFVPMPLKGLLDKSYLAKRGKLLAGGRALPKEGVEAGEPPWDHAELRGTAEPIELPSTSHFSIVDAAGNMVSMTTTIENGFGSRLMVGGFLLNNELTDFSFATHAKGVPVANRVEPGKRPRSSMAPTIVMENGVPVMAVGSPGGSQIIGYVAQALVALIDWKMDPAAAAAMPHVLNRSGPIEIEASTSAERFTEAFRAMGYEVKAADMTSGLHIVRRLPDGTLEGGADPRREGIALGD